MKCHTPCALDLWVRQFHLSENPAVLCTFCGAIGTMAYTQPVHPFWAEKPQYGDWRNSPFLDGRWPNTPFQCHDCRNAEILRLREERKAQLKEEPRCEVCSRRGCWRMAGHLLCGKHKNQVIASVSKKIAGSGLGGLALFGDIGQSSILAGEIEAMVGGAQ